MYKIRIYLKSGNQIELWVKEFTITPNAEGSAYKAWEAKWDNDGSPYLLSLLPSQIEGVLVLHETIEVPTDLGQQKK